MHQPIKYNQHKSHVRTSKIKINILPIFLPGELMRRGKVCVSQTKAREINYLEETFLFPLGEYRGHVNLDEVTPHLLHTHATQGPRMYVDQVVGRADKVQDQINCVSKSNGFKPPIFPCVEIGYGKVPPFTSIALPCHAFLRQAVKTKGGKRHFDYLGTC